jgi:type VI protein secretion system component Hcp
MAINARTNLGGLKPEPLGGTQSETSSLGGNKNFHLVDISSFSLGAENTTTIGSQSGGAGAGKVKFQSFQVVKELDSLSPSLLLDLAAGHHYDTVLIVVRRRSGHMSVPSFVYEMKLVFLTKIHVSGSTSAPTETITGDAGSLALATYNQNSQGQVSLGSTAGWNRVSNTQQLSVGTS